MRIKRIKSIKINSYTFKVYWNRKWNGGQFSYREEKKKEGFIDIGVKDNSDNEIFMIICHELMEICAAEMNVRLKRPDCDSDYVFVYDHRQHETMMNMFAGALSQFIE